MEALIPRYYMELWVSGRAFLFFVSFRYSIQVCF